MRFATIFDGRYPEAVAVADGRFLKFELPHHYPPTMRDLAGMDADSLRLVRGLIERHAGSAWRSLEGVELGPAVPDPGAIFAIGLNYRASGDSGDPEPVRPLVYAKLPTSVAGPGAVLSWDRSLTPNVDAEVELGIVIGQPAVDVAPEEAMKHVFGYTVINDVSSRDPWLDGDQWLLGKSFAGFCPVGPWVVTCDEVAPEALRLGCTINGVAIQDGNTARMRFSVAEVISFLSRHTALRAGDLIATGTPARLAGPMGPERHLQAGDVVTVWIEGIGELTTTIA